MCRGFLAVLLFLVVPFPSAAAPLTRPAPGSTARRAILDTLRPTAEREARQKGLVFRVHQIAAQEPWAFVYAEVQRADGHRIDWSRTRYAEAHRAGAFDPGIGALLKRRGKRWRIVQYTFGATDVPWVDWDRRYGAPRAIFRPD